MLKKSLFVFSFFLLACFSATESHSEMTSDSYKISTSVVSGGGVAMDSNSYKKNSTIGQASPLVISPDNELSSNLFKMHPGFWNTVNGNQTTPVALSWLILLLSD